MGKVKQVTVRHSVDIAPMYQKCGIRGKKLYEKYPEYSRAAIYQHALKPISSDIDSIDKRKQNKGRPTKFSEKDTCCTLRVLLKLRKNKGSFTTPRIAWEAGLSGKVSNCAIQRILHRAGYYYLKSRKKGLLSFSDFKERVDFCRNVKQKKLHESY